MRLIKMPAQDAVFADLFHLRSLARLQSHHQSQQSSEFAKSLQAKGGREGNCTKGKEQHAKQSDK